MNRVIVVGLGKFGRALVETLVQEGADVLAIDRDMEVVQQASDFLPAVIQADATDAEALASAGVKGASAAVVAIGSDFRAAAFATSILRELGVERITARVNSEREARILRLVGATEIVFVEQEMGRRIALSFVGR